MECLCRVLLQTTPMHLGRFFRCLRSVRRRSPTTHTIHKIHNLDKNSSGGTHTGELDATVTALGSGTLLLQVKVPELAAGGLDNANLVRPRVVPIGGASICRSSNQGSQPVHCDRIEYHVTRREGIVRGEGIFDSTYGLRRRLKRKPVSIIWSGSIYCQSDTHVLQSVVRHFDCA